MYTVYSDSPWLMPPDPASTALIFHRLGRPVTLRARSVVNFGASHKVYLLQSGIVATFAGGVGNYERMAAFFTAGCTLGAVKAMTHRGAQMKLAARVYREAKALEIDSSQFMRELERDPKVFAETALNFVQKNEATVDGLLLNDLLKVPERLSKMIALLFEMDGKPLTDTFQPLPDCFTVTDLSMMIHATRVAVSQTLSRWAKARVIGGRDGDWRFNRKLVESQG